MKNHNRILIAFCSIVLALSLMGGCATTGEFVTALGSPAQIQADVTILGSVAKPRITNASVLTKIHKFANDLLQASNLDSSQLKALIPATGNPSADALIAAGASFIDSAIAKWGSRNTTTLAYARAVAQGLLNAGF